MASFGMAASRAGGVKLFRMSALYAVLFLLAAGLGAAAVFGLGRLPYAATTADDVAAHIETFTKNNPGAGAMFAALKEHYPSAYGALTTRAAAALRRGDMRGAEIAAFETAQSLSRSKLSHLAHASPDRLYDWGKSALALMNAAQSAAPKVCAQVAFGSLDRSAAGPTLANAVGRHAAAAIVAFREGETSPRKYPALTNADQTAFARSIAAQGLSPAETKSLEYIATIRSLPERQQCGLGIKLLRGVVATPEPVRSRILSRLAAEAGGRQ